MTNAVIYARNSTKNQQMDKTEEIQLNSLKDYCKRNNYTILNIYVDTGVSGAKIKRTQLDSLKLFIENEYHAETNTNLVDVVLVTKLDRLVRSASQLYQIINFFKDHNVAVICTEQNLTLTNYETDITTKVLVSTFGLIADIERSLIVERMTAGREKAKIYGTKSGKLIGGQKKQVDEKVLTDLWNARVSVSALSRKFKVSRATINNRLYDLGLKTKLVRN